MYVHIQSIFIYKEKYMITCKYLDNTYWFKGQFFSDQTVELTSFPLSVVFDRQKDSFFVGMCFSFPQDLVRHMVE